MRLRGAGAGAGLAREEGAHTEDQEGGGVRAFQQDPRLGVWGPTDPEGRGREAERSVL